MRAYRASDEEALRARNLLKAWAGEGFLTEAQYQRMEEETVCELRRTNIFLRIVLFLFTLLIGGAAVALFFVVLFAQAPVQSAGFFLLVCAAASYAAAEFVVFRARLFRYGIEEAFAVCSVGYLCAGMLALIGRYYSGRSHGMESLIPAAGAILSLWIWRRFGLPYAFLAAMLFAALLPGYWTSSLSAQHVIVAAFYAASLITVAEVRSRYRFTYLDQGCSIVDGLLWLGIYLAINLQLSSAWSTTEFSQPFYWATWVLTWCLPPAALAHGLRRKDRFVIAAGAVAAILTFVTNKPYLGWPRHSWDPMLLGALLIGVALWIRRWLAAGPDGIRHGFTAQRLSGKDKRWMSVFGLVMPQAITPSPQAGSPGVQFGGGDSGGGGATSDF